MIYNLWEYIRLQLPTLTFTTNGFLKETPEEALTLIDNGGTAEPWINRNEYAIQCLSRALKKVDAKSNIELVYAKLNRRFGLVLPQVTIDGELFPVITTYQISPNQLPGYIGSDDQNLEMWSVNFRIITA